MLSFLGAVLLFLVGLRLSAFFSGSETGFYRASFLRLTIDAQAGDRIAKRLLWFARNPSYFVATTLVGNNVANYTTTAAINLGAVALLENRGDWVEIVGTLLLSPVIFVFGELVPKNVYYRAPLQLLRRGSRLFRIFYWLFLPVSLPLVGITKLLERFERSEKGPMELVLGRSRLAQVFVHGRQEGILTDVQNRLVHGLLHTAARPVSDSMTPASRAFGLPESSSREQILSYAQRFGTSSVLMSRDGVPEEWYGYLRVADVAISPKPVKSLIRPMPVVAPTLSRLETLLMLRNAGEQYGQVARNGKVLGVISERGLIEQLFRPIQGAGTTLPGPV